MLKEFAKDLKKLREIKGISIAEISAETRINSKFLNLMESGVFDFQPDAYIRSFLKEYARAIDEDEKKLLSDYDKAKAGFYAPKKFAGTEDNKKSSEVSVKAIPIENFDEPGSGKPVYQSGLKADKPDYYKTKQAFNEPEISDKSTLRKVIIVIFFIALAAAIYFLIDYLNDSGDKKSGIKPKTFNEISSDYESKLNRRKDSLKALDSLKKLSADSLQLVIKALKDIRVIVYIDDDGVKYDEELAGKDSLVVKAAEQFKFSTSNISNTEIYLNGKYLKKPVTNRGSSLKDLIITKEGTKQSKSENSEQ